MALEMGVTPRHLRTSYNLLFMSWELETDGCESEFIEGHFENRILNVCSNRIRESIWRNILFQIYPLLFTLHA